MSAPLLEVYALQIQMYSDQKDTKKLRDLYQKARRVQGDVPHPRTLGVILECGGKMHMQEREWQDAASAFFQSFKNYDEAGEPRRLQSLKYLVLSAMLHQSKVDPFDSQVSVVR
jgi:COP9 signalosome complex subunit 2